MKKRMSLPPVQRFSQQRKNEHIETLLHQLRTPTNPRVNIKFAKALQDCNDASKKGPRLVSDFHSSRFRALFGLITSRDDMKPAPVRNVQVKNPFVAKAISPTSPSLSREQIEIQKNQQILD